MAHESDLVREKLSAARTVRVFIPADVAFSLEKMNKVTANVLGRLGCAQCHSGFDIRFIHELDFVINPKTLEAQGMPIAER